jgi:NAD-dependent deacetylase
MGTLALVYFGTPKGWNMTPATAFSMYLKNFYKPIMRAEPNAGHHALFELETILKHNAERNQNIQSFDVVTMNVDGFHQRAGHEPERVHEVHGTVLNYRCIKNGHRMNIDAELLEFMNTGKLPNIKCEICKSYPRPDCVLFTESLPGNIWDAAENSVRSLRRGDVMLVIGTSNKVYPAASLPHLAEKNGASVFHFNVVESNDVDAELQVIGRAGQVLPEVVEQVRILLKI